MILTEQLPLRPPRLGLIAIALMAMVASPAWLMKSDAQTTDETRARSEYRSRVNGAITFTNEVAPALPPDAQEVLRSFEDQRAKIMAEVSQRLAEQRQLMIQHLRDLQDRYTKAGQLDEAVAIRDRVRELQGQGEANRTATINGYLSPNPPRATPIIPDPGNAIQFRGQDHRTMRVEVVGSTDGQVWGTGPYTDDSSIAAAAVHAGLLQPNQRGVVLIEILPGQDRYDGSASHGVTSAPYGPWPGSYSITPRALLGPINVHGNHGTIGIERRPAPVALADPGTLVNYRDRVGQSFLFQIEGSVTGEIWGTGTYTDDSPLAVAAVHAGLVAPGQTKTVRVFIRPGQQMYQGSTQNGVTSEAWGPWQGTYQILPDERLDVWFKATEGRSSGPESHTPEPGNSSNGPLPGVPGSGGAAPEEVRKF